MPVRGLRPARGWGRGRRRRLEQLIAQPKQDAIIRNLPAFIGNYDAVNKRPTGAAVARCLHEPVFGRKRQTRHGGNRIGKTGDHLIGKAAIRLAYRGVVEGIVLVLNLLISDTGTEVRVNRQTDIEVVIAICHEAIGVLDTRNMNLYAIIAVKFG